MLSKNVVLRQERGVSVLLGSYAKICAANLQKCTRQRLLCSAERHLLTSAECSSPVWTTVFVSTLNSIPVPLT